MNKQLQPVVKELTIQEVNKAKIKAVKEFASKLKDKATDFLFSAAVDGRPGFDINISELCHVIDELLYETLSDCNMRIYAEAIYEELQHKQFGNKTGFRKGYQKGFADGVKFGKSFYEPR